MKGTAAVFMSLQDRNQGNQPLSFIVTPAASLSSSWKYFFFNFFYSFSIIPPLHRLQFFFRFVVHSEKRMIDLDLT